MSAQSETEPDLRRPHTTVAGYLLAAPLCALATLLAVIVDGWVAVPNLSLVFVLPVVILAVTFGLGPALTAAVAGVLAFNFFLIEPRYTLRVNDPANVWALGLMLLVAGIVSGVAAQSRRRALQAQEHADQADALQHLARDLVAASERSGIVDATEGALARLFGGASAVLLSEGDDLATTATARQRLTAPDFDAARWALTVQRPTRADTYSVEGSTFDFWPVSTRSRLRAVIGLQLPVRAEGRPTGTERLVEIVSGYLAVALERERYARQAFEARVGLESERVKADLLAAVSHDLRTPLSTILFSLQSLQRFGEKHDAETRAELLSLAATETARLSGLVANLLEMSRIDADAVAVKVSPVFPADLIASALDRARLALSGRRVENQVGGTVAPVLIDAPLTETALANVLENAAKYSPDGSTIVIRATAADGACEIEVLDEGPGFPTNAEPLFEKFTRGVQGDGRPPGTGLGLAIARGFLQAQGGRIQAANRADRTGGMIRVSLPLATALEKTR